MLLSAGDLIDAVEQLAAEQHVDALDMAAMRGALRAARAEAEFVAGAERDASAALFFALARRSRSFVPMARRTVLYLVRLQAFENGDRIAADDLALDSFRAGIALGDLQYTHVRAWLAPKLVPLP